jgi:hypothetical protein
MVHKDAEHLNILSIVWYVLAGLQCLGMCAGVAYIVMAGVFASKLSDPGDPPMGIIMGIFGVILIVISLVFAGLSYLTGKSLKQRRRLMLCYVMAALVCLSFPLGTALGVFTFIVLARPSVKASFQ